MPELVVQMGHVGRPPNPGSRGTAGEQEFSKAVGAECVRHLHGRNGWTVTLVAADPPASAYRGDWFVSIHCDGSTSASSRGASLGHQSAEGRAFAHAVRAAYERRGWSGGWKPDNYTTALGGYYGVREALKQGTRRAFIFETGTMTNAADRALMTGPGGHARVALAIGDALGITQDQQQEAPEMDPITLQNNVYAAVANLFTDAAWGTTSDPANRLRGALRVLLPLDVDERALVELLQPPLAAAIDAAVDRHGVDLSPDARAEIARDVLAGMGERLGAVTNDQATT